MLKSRERVIAPMRQALNPAVAHVLMHQIYPLDVIFFRCAGTLRIHQIRATSIRRWASEEIPHESSTLHSSVLKLFPVPQKSLRHCKGAVGGNYRMEKLDIRIRS
jgi:hypothetical protein